MNVFEKSFLINDSHTGLNRICKMSAIINFIQYTTISHILCNEDKQETMELYAKVGMFLTNVRIKLNRPLYYGEVINVKTYQCPLTSSKIYRVCKLYVKEELVGEAVTVALLVDLQTRKLISPNMYVDNLKKFIYSGKNEKISIKKIGRRKVINTKTYEVEYSDTDKNGHMNNVRYAELISNIINMSEQQDKYISEMQIDFISECSVGQEIKLGSVKNDDVFYVQGVDMKNKLKFNGEAHLTAI